MKRYLCFSEMPFQILSLMKTFSPYIFPYFPLRNRSVFLFVLFILFFFFAGLVKDVSADTCGRLVNYTHKKKRKYGMGYITTRRTKVVGFDCGAGTPNSGCPKGEFLKCPDNYTGGGGCTCTSTSPGPGHYRRNPDNPESKGGVTAPNSPPGKPHGKCDDGSEPTDRFESGRTTYECQKPPDGNGSCSKGKLVDGKCVYDPEWFGPPYDDPDSGGIDPGDIDSGGSGSDDTGSGGSGSDDTGSGGSGSGGSGTGGSGSGGSGSDGSGSGGSGTGGSGSGGSDDSVGNDPNSPKIDIDAPKVDVDFSSFDEDCEKARQSCIRSCQDGVEIFNCRADKIDGNVMSKIDCICKTSYTPPSDISDNPGTSYEPHLNAIKDDLDILIDEGNDANKLLSVNAQNIYSIGENTKHIVRNMGSIGDAIGKGVGEVSSIRDMLGDGVDISGKSIHSIGGSVKKGVSDAINSIQFSGEPGLDKIDNSSVIALYDAEKKKFKENVSLLFSNTKDLFSLNLVTASGLPVYSFNLKVYGNLKFDFSILEKFPFFSFIFPMLASFSAIFIIFE